MELTTSGCGGECVCNGPGYCPCYGSNMPQRLHAKCKSSQKWRDNFSHFFANTLSDETKAFGSAKADAVMEEIRQREMARKVKEKDLDDAMAEIQSKSQGADMEGLGDLVENVLTKFGITQERVQSALGTPDCGCNQRKQFLNRLFPFARKNDEQKKETGTE